MKNRRDFLISSLVLSAGLSSCSKLNLFGDKQNDLSNVAKPDIKSLSYCCSKCNEKCALFIATANNDSPAKQALAEKWKWKKENGEAFTVDEIFCYGCKEEGKPQNIKLQKCVVRKCAKEKQLESCSLCGDLEKCDKEYWSKYPKLKLRVLKIQKELNG